MVLSLVILNLKQLARHPINWLLLAVYCALLSLMASYNVESYWQLQNSGQSDLTLSGSFFYTQFNVSLLLIMLIVPFFAVQLDPARQQSGLTQLLATTCTPLAAFRVADYVTQTVLSALLMSLHLVLLLPLIMANTIDWPVLTTMLIAQYLMLLFYLALVFCLMPKNTKTIAGFAIYFSVLLVLWMLEFIGQSLNQLETLSPLFRYRKFALGNLDYQSLALVLLSTAGALLVITRAQHTLAKLRTAALRLMVFSLLLLVTTPFISWPTDITSNQRYSLLPELGAKLATKNKINVRYSGLAASDIEEIKLRLLAPLSQAGIPISVTEEVQLTAAMEIKRGIQIELNDAHYWLNYPFAMHPQYLLLQQLQVTAVREQSWLLFTDGHQESSILQSGGRHLAKANQHINDLGFQAQQTSLLSLAEIPSNVSLLIIAGAQQPLLHQEWLRISEYLSAGGNLLWLREPNEPQQPQLEAYLGLGSIPGTLIDPAGYQAGTPHPAIVLLREINNNPLSTNLNSLLAFPWSTALTQIQSTNQWQVALELSTHNKVWTEFEPNNEQLQFNPEQGELEGQFALLYGLTRQQGANQQRVIVVGDVHFIADAAIDNYANRQLLTNILHWLQPVAPPENFTPQVATDRVLQLNTFANLWYLSGAAWIMTIIGLILGGLAWRQASRH